MTKERICITIDKNLLQHLKEMAEKENRTLSNLINKMLKEK